MKSYIEVTDFKETAKIVLNSGPLLPKQIARLLRIVPQLSAYQAGSNLNRPHSSETKTPESQCRRFCYSIILWSIIKNQRVSPDN